jgi:hypothetical protein
VTLWRILRITHLVLHFYNLFLTGLPYRTSLMLIHQSLIVFLVALAPVTCSVLNTRQSAPPDGSVKIGRVMTGGNGCLQGSVPFNIYSNQTVIFQRLTEFHVSLGPSIAAAERTKNCAFHIDITYPTGWQFLLVQSSYGGYARLDKGVGGHFFAQYFLSSAPSHSVSFHDSNLQLLSCSISIRFRLSHDC